MKNFLRLLLLTMFFANNVSSQISFETGYFINETGEKINCLIQNERWLFSPTEIFYKTSEEGEVKSFTVENCEEFQIGNDGKYKRIRTKLPITQSKLKKKEKSPEPEMVERSAFVQTVVQGFASLYWYVDNNGIVYLYNKDGGPIMPLIYKKYVLNNLKVKENTTYKTQLIKDFECGNDIIVQKTTYKRKSLITYFEYLNTCSGNSDFTVYKRTAKQKANFALTFKVWAGLENNGYETRLRNPERLFEFENVVSAKFGGELEAFFPYFGFKKVSLYLSGQFSQTDNSFTFPQSEIGQVSYNADYSIFELQIGARYYIDLGKKSSVFIEAALAPDFFGNSTVDEDRIVRVILENERLETRQIGSSFSSRLGASFGLGYSYNKKVYIRAAIRTEQVVLDETIFFEDGLSRLSLSLGYAFW